MSMRIITDRIISIALNMLINMVIAVKKYYLYRFIKFYIFSLKKFINSVKVKTATVTLYFNDDA